MFSDEDLLEISSLQHLSFCERQWMLIHMERLWSENVLTVEGRQLHEFVHEQGSESRAGVRMVRGLRLRSLAFGLCGVADLVEFHPDDDGIFVEGLDGRWLPFPVEYKRGRKRYDIADEIQLCAQAVCLEEMFSIEVAAGAIYYGQPRRRVQVEISGPLKANLKRQCERARALLDFKDRPVANIGRHCRSCSLNEECMPDVIGNDRSVRYVSHILGDLIMDVHRGQIQ